MNDAAGRPLDVNDAVGLILQATARGAVEYVPLPDAAGRTLGEPITAAEDLWPFARAAMDGVAARAHDVAGASNQHPVRLRISAAVYAGEPADVALQPGACVRVATGAPVPPGADTIIPQELLRADDGAVIVSQPAARGQHIFPAGEDVRAGERVLDAGTILRGGHLGLLASIGRASVPVVRRPVVAIMTCGDELIDPAQALRPGLVRESNRFALAAGVEAIGALVVRLDNARDTDAEIDGAVRRGLEADVLITSGGLSVGERDLVRPALRRAGVAIAFESVAMKPGARVAFGRIGHRLVFGLPGTPSACRVAFEILVVPALRAMLGYSSALRPTLTARITAPVRVRPGRRRYLWGLVALDPDGVMVTPHLVQSTATLRASSDANALIVLDAQTADLPAGARVRVQLLDAEALNLAPPRQQVVIGIVGERGAGKTRLIERLLPELARQGATAAVVKHHAHQTTLDVDGSDTARAASAGAVRTILTGRGGVTTRTPSAGDPTLEDALTHAGAADIVLVEGFSQSPIPKILVLGGSSEPAKAAPAGPIVAAVGDGDGDAGNAPARDGTARFRWDQIDQLAHFILSRGGGSRA